MGPKSDSTRRDAHAENAREHAMGVLVVEHERGVARRLARALRASTFEVTLCTSGEAALRSFAPARHDAVVMERDVPDRDALELCRELRRLRADLFIVVVAARSGLAEELEAFDAGADDVLVKPCEPDRIVARMAAFRRRCGPMRPSESRDGVLVVDEIRRTVLVGDREVDLTALQFRLLGLLVRARGATVSRAALLERAWSLKRDPGTNLIEVQLARLRTKLGEADRWRISNERGRGYFVAGPAALRDGHGPGAVAH